MPLNPGPYGPHDLALLTPAYGRTRWGSRYSSRTYSAPRLVMGSLFTASAPRVYRCPDYLLTTLRNRRVYGFDPPVTVRFHRTSTFTIADRVA